VLGQIGKRRLRDISTHFRPLLRRILRRL